jgi:invasion protein IalB
MTFAMPVQFFRAGPVFSKSSLRVCSLVSKRQALAASATAVLLSLMTSTVHAQESAAQSDAAKQPSTEVRTERFDDWMLRCVVAAGVDHNVPEKASCEIAQPLMVDQGGKPVEVLNLAISRANDKAGKANWALVALTPLDVHLASDFGFGAGSAKPSLVRYRNCNHAGCFVIIPLDNNRISQMKQASDGATFFRLLNGQAVKVSFSLKGFTRAFDALSAGIVPATGKTTGETPMDAGKEGANN